MLPSLTTHTKPIFEVDGGPSELECRGWVEKLGQIFSKMTSSGEREAVFAKSEFSEEVKMGEET